MTDEEAKHLEATKKIADLLKQAEAALNEAASIADENGVSFGWDGPAYGMGGYYQPKVDNEDSEEEEDDWCESSGWRSSSSY